MSQISVEEENSAKIGIKLQFERNDLLHSPILKNVVDISFVKDGLGKRKLVCQGRSNGGALIGAVMNRAGEEIFAAGIAQVGYFHSFEFD